MFKPFIAFSTISKRNAKSIRKQKLSLVSRFTQFDRNWLRDWFLIFMMNLESCSVFLQSPLSTKRLSNPGQSVYKWTKYPVSLLGLYVEEYPLLTSHPQVWMWENPHPKVCMCKAASPTPHPHRTRFQKSITWMSHCTILIIWSHSERKRCIIIFKQSDAERMRLSGPSDQRCGWRWLMTLSSLLCCERLDVHQPWTQNGLFGKLLRTVFIIKYKTVCSL